MSQEHPTSEFYLQHMRRREITRRLQEEYSTPTTLSISLQQKVGRIAPDALIAPDAPLNRRIRFHCDEMEKVLKAYKMEPTRERLLQVLIQAEVLKRYGYHAVADLGRKNYIHATRKNLVVDMREIHKAFEIIALEVLDAQG